MNGCPSTHQFEQLLAEQLNEAEKAEVEMHVEVCAACQHRLEQLAGDTPLDEARDRDSGRAGDPPRLDLTFLDALKQALPEARNGSSSAGTRPAEAPGGEPASFPTVRGYEVLRELGHGGMGVVYQARQVGLNRLVALKMLPGEAQASTGALARFRTEAEAVARLAHPNIVQVYEVGEAGGRPYLALEHVDGSSLARKIGGTPLPARHAAELVETLARAMHAAHQQRIVHRDLKPANVLLTADGVPKITDFGLAKLLDGAVGQTQSGGVLGTPPYMAPEQAAGKGKQVGPHTDVYALGAILYEALTGRAPFQADTPLETLQQVVAEEPALPSRLRPKLPPDLETICLKCLQKEPARRYASAAALADDLQRFLAGEPIRARPVGRAEKVWRWCRRNPGLAGAVGAASLFLVLGTLVSSLLAVRALGEVARADRETVIAREAKQFSDRRYYGSEMKLASLDYVAGQVDLAQQRLQKFDPLAAVGQVGDGPYGDTDLRGFEWHYLQRLCQLELRSVQGHAGQVLGVAFSPDGRRLASAGEDGTVRVWDTATSKAIFPLRGHTGPVWGVAFSPDGRRVASAGQDGTVRLWDAATGQQLRKLEEHTGVVRGVAFSHDGRLASAGRDGTVKVRNAATGEILHNLTGHTGEVLGVAFSPDGRLASAGQDRTVRLWDAATGQQLHKLEGHTGEALAVAFSPDGHWLASGGGNPEGIVRVWDAATGQPLRTFDARTAWVWGVAFSPDGRRLASAGQDGAVRLWDAATGEELDTLRPLTGRVSGVAFSPDGRRFAAAFPDGAVRVRDAATRQKPLTFQGHAGSVVGVAFSLDGKQIASVSGDQTVKVWDAVTGEETLSLNGHTHWVVGVAFSPDGRRLASASQDGTVRLWDAATGQRLRTFEGHTGGVWGVAFSPNGKQLASASQDGTVKVWDATTGKILHDLTGHTGGVWGVAFSPDGRRLAFASGDQTHRHPGPFWLESGRGDQTVKVWDLATGQQAFSFEGHKSSVWGVAFSPDGRRLASAGGLDRTVRVWDTATGQKSLVLQGHPGSVQGVAFSPDGRRLASAGDKTVRVWDTATGQELLTLQGHTRPVYGVAFSPDGRRIASASVDGTVKVWDASELTPERRIEHEARGLVQFLFESRLPVLPTYGASTVGLMASARGPGPLLAASALIPGRTPLPEEVAAAIRRDPTITEAVRQEALAWVEPYGRILVRAEAEALLNACLPVLSQFGAGAAKYQLALRQAAAAFRLVPDDAVYVHAFGVAQYHVGKYQEAVEKLILAEKLGGQRFQGFYHCNLKFLALAQHQLGRKAEAQAALDRLRESMRKVEPARLAAVQRHLREAEAVLKPNPAGGKKPVAPPPE